MQGSIVGVSTGGIDYYFAAHTAMRLAEGSASSAAMAPNAPPQSSSDRAIRSGVPNSHNRTPRYDRSSTFAHRIPPSIIHYSQAVTDRCCCSPLQTDTKILETDTKLDRARSLSPAPSTPHRTGPSVQKLCRIVQMASAHRVDAARHNTSTQGSKERHCSVYQTHRGNANIDWTHRSVGDQDIRGNTSCFLLGAWCV